MGKGGLEISMGKLTRGDSIGSSNRPQIHRRTPSRPATQLVAGMPSAPPVSESKEITRPDVDSVTRVVAAPSLRQGGAEVDVGVSSLGRGLRAGFEGHSSGVSLRSEGSSNGGVLGRGMAGHAVEALQLALGRAGFEVEASGFFDDTTGTRLADFQRSVGLRGTGQADLETRVQLSWTRVTLGSERLQLGSRGHAVRRLRELLILPADTQARATIFDDECDQVARSFQASVRLNPDGVIGSQAAAELEWHQVRSGRMELHSGRRGPVVRKLQAMLARVGTSSVQTGLFAASTTSELRTLQTRYGLPATGYLDAATLALLERLLERTDPTTVAPLLRG